MGGGGGFGCYLPLVSREWKNGSNGSYSCTPFLHSLPPKGKVRVSGFSLVKPLTPGNKGGWGWRLGS